MYLKKCSLLLAILSLIALTGCPRSVTIIRPSENSYVGLNSISNVEFHQRADTNSFDHDLYLRSRFAGGYVWNLSPQRIPYIVDNSSQPRTAEGNLPYLLPGWYKLNTKADFHPSRMGDVHGHSIQFRIVRKPFSFGFPQYQGTSVTSGGSGSSGSGSVGGVVLGTRYRLTIYQPVTITIYAVSTATSDINITMTSSQGAITITPNSVTIPANQNSTNFTVTAQQEGPINVTVKARSHGYHDTILEFYGVR